MSEIINESFEDYKKSMLVNKKSLGNNIDLSIVMPCYNEGKVLPITIPPLVKLLDKNKINYELILVDNGSRDSTSNVIDSFIEEGYQIKKVKIEINQGVGWGIICGLEHAKGKYVGYMSPDGQIIAEDVIKTYNLIKGKNKGTIVKVKRCQRNDGIIRLLYSKCFNFIFFVLFGRITSDVNGQPKIMHRADLSLIKPRYKDAFIDSEGMIKANYLKMNILEIPVMFYKRAGGKSNVKAMFVGFGLLKNMISYRFGNEFKEWKNEIKEKPYKRRRVI